MGKAAGIVALITETDAVTLFDALAGARESLPARLVGAHVQRGRNSRLRRAFAQANALKLGGNDAGIVEDKRIAGLQERRQVKDAVVFHAVFIRIDHQQARAVARVRRAKGDILLGQIEIEQVYTHCKGLPDIKTLHGTVNFGPPHPAHSPHSCACHRNPVDTRLRGEGVFPAQRLGLAGFL
ncbi:hypothetical protein D3C80_690470 [compost metagenome]